MMEIGKIRKMMETMTSKYAAIKIWNLTASICCLIYKMYIMHHYSSVFILSPIFMFSFCFRDRKNDALLFSNPLPYQIASTYFRKCCYKK
jgi:hypothetical protein